MKTKALFFSLLVTLFLASCKKGDVAPETTDPEITTPVTATDTPTEGTVVIADNPGNTAKYDDKNIPLQTFTVGSKLVYIYPFTSQITLQSTEKEGVLYKYSIGLNVNGALPAVGVKTSTLAGTTPLVGLNTYVGTALYSYSCMNGTYTIEAMDAHNITVLFSNMDMKQSYTMGFDAANKRFSVKSFRVKATY